MRRVGVAALPKAGFVTVQTDDFVFALRHTGFVLLLHQDDCGARIGQHECDALGGIVRIYGNADTPRLQNRQSGTNHFRTALHEHRDAGLDPAPASIRQWASWFARLFSSWYVSCVSP